MLKKKHILLFGFSVVIIIIIILFSFPINILELKSLNNGELYFIQRVRPGDNFILKYTHSVALTPVWEIFNINEDYQIVLIETDFLDHGAGLPYASFKNEIFVEEEGRFKIKNMHRIIPIPFYYRIGETRENIFYFKDEEVNLSSLAGDELLTIEIDKTNLFKYLLGGNL